MNPPTFYHLLSVTRKMLRDYCFILQYGYGKRVELSEYKPLRLFRKSRRTGIFLMDYLAHRDLLEQLHLHRLLALLPCSLGQCY